MTTGRKLHIGTNLKMYKTARETRSFLTDLDRLVRDIADDLLLFVIPSYTSLTTASDIVDSGRIQLGAQNMHWEERGEFTGEISPLMLQELGIQIVEIGHSERRRLFRETDLEANKKVFSAISHGFVALLCVGETANDKELDVGDERLREQLTVGLHGLGNSDCDKLWVAYEPVWAVGSGGIPARADYANAKHLIIRESLLQLFPHNGQDIPILYGGSVNSENACEFMRQPSIDGLFVGRSAWDALQFNSLIRQVLPVWQKKIANTFR